MELKSSEIRSIPVPSERSNRTFMELKLEGALEELRAELSSNRTFMELKFRKNKYGHY